MPQMMSTSEILPAELQAALKSQLVTGERLVWSAQPHANRLKSGFFLWIFALPWTVFALFWESMSLLPWFGNTKSPDQVISIFAIIMSLFGLPFILVGLWMLWTPIKAMRQARFTAYGLSNKRLFRVVIGKSCQITSVILFQIGPMTRKQSTDGIGNLRIQTHSRIDSEGDRTTESFEILGVANVAQLERLILENCQA
jgi:hypothetical protein